MAVPRYALTGNWSNANTWALTSGGAPGAGKPVGGQDAIFDSNSGNVTMDEHSAAGLNLLDMLNYYSTLAMGTYEIDVNGNVTTGGTITAAAGARITLTGSFTKSPFSLSPLPDDLAINLDGAGNVTCNSFAGGALTINCTGTMTFTDAQYWSSYTFMSGTVEWGNYKMTVAGAIASANLASQNDVGIVHQTVSATLNWRKSTNAMLEFQNDEGNTTTVTEWAYNTKVTDGLKGAIVDDGGNEYFAVRPAGTDNFWRPAATATFVDVLIGWLYPNNLTPGGDVIIPNADRLQIWENDETLTFDGKVECAKFYLQPTQALKFAKVITDGYPFLIHNGAWIGKTSATNATGGGVIDARGSYMKVEGTLQKGHANNTMNQILMPDILDMSGGGSLNGTLIDVDAVEDNCHIIGGTCSWVEADNDVHCHGTTDGGANDKLTFNEYVQPGSLAACGAGV